MYRVIGLFEGFGRKLAQILKPFEKIYRASGIDEPYEIYMSIVIFLLVVTTPIVFSLTTFLHTILLRFKLTYAIIASIPLTLSIELMVFALLIYYPVYRVYSRRTVVNSRLPYTVAYMASLASAGLGVERIVERSVEVEDDPNIRRELALILRDIKVFGLDTSSALSRAIERSPSDRLGLFLVGVKDTYVTSGDLKGYMLFTARRLIEDKSHVLRNVVNTLSLLAELYTTMMVAAPLMFVVMLSIMSLLGGTIAGLPPTLLVFILIFVIIPFSAMGILIAVDSVLSKV